MRHGAFLGALFLVASLAGSGRAEEGFPFAEWSPETFARAKRERKILLVTLTTTWCHWCHEMQRVTYGDERVRAVLRRSFLPVRVDGDSRPDLAERFRDYHWPATAFLTPDATPILALRGYRSPEDFLAILADVQARVAKGGPFPGFGAPAASGPAEAPDRARLEALRDRLRTQLDRSWDEAQAGWGSPQKYPVPEPIEHGLFLARLGRGGEGDARERALRALAAERALLDPVWGGMFQYSVEGVWTRPHFEKIVSVNAGALLNFAQARIATGDADWNRGAREVWRWVKAFLVAPDGTFYASQDAEPPGGLKGEVYFAMDDAGRRSFGIPRVDRNVYARENGQMIRALATWGIPEAVAAAGKAAAGILATHRAADGLFVHGVGQKGVKHLADQAELGLGLVALHQQDPQTKWLDAAVALGKAMLTGLRDEPRGGFFDHTPDPAASGVFAERLRSLETNASVARFLLALHALTEDDAFRDAALSAIAAVSDARSVEARGRYVGDLLLAVEEALLKTARIQVVGKADDERTRAFLREAALLRERPVDLFVVRTEPEGDAAPVALVCGAGFCSDPVRDPAFLGRAVWLTTKR